MKNDDLTPRQKTAKNQAKQYFLSPIHAQTAAIGGVINSFSFETNVIGIGIGPKIVGNSVEAQEAVRVYVRVKIPRTELTANDVIPPNFGNLPTDVIEIGDVTAFPVTKTWDRQKRNRPTSCGVSVGHPNITAGTLGCLVEKNNDTYILSNNHVLADCNQAAFGDKIIQPGKADSGSSPSEDIATLSDWKPLDFTGNPNDIDAAIAKLDDVATVEQEIIDIGSPLKITASAALYQSVRKHGRTTGHTVGVITDLSVDIWVSYGVNGRAWFENQLGITGIYGQMFSQGGDSGSLIVDAVTLNPVGLLFAGGNGITFANRIDDVLSHFNVQIVGV